MSKIRTWQGVRMRKVWAGADPDAEPRLVVLPAAWDDGAAAALAGLTPEGVPSVLASVADRWVRALTLRTGQSEAAELLHELLLMRQAAPSRAIWLAADKAGEAGPRGFVLNLAAFRRSLVTMTIV